VIHHVQIACPTGSEEVLRGYYVDVLGLAEVPKPPALAARGGCWFSGYGIELHLGVEADFRPARKAHPGRLWPDLDALATRLADAGYPVRWAAEGELPGMRRFHTDDPHGNRLEFLARA
jgi:catechol 2,3-dioxygenase-like lactoylglutathione lyase family enzyme